MAFWEGRCAAKENIRFWDWEDLATLQWWSRWDDGRDQGAQCGSSNRLIFAQRAKRCELNHAYRSRILWRRNRTG